MKTIESGAEKAFTFEQYLAMKDKLAQYGQHSLYFEANEISVVRSNSTRKRDPILWIANYGKKNLPPYEQVIGAIKYAAKQFECEVSAGRS